MNKPGKWWIAAVGGVVLASVLGAGAVMAQTPPAGTSGTGTTFLERVAAKLGIDVGTVRDAVTSSASDEIDARVASGDLTQAQADQMKLRIANAPDSALDIGRGFGGRGHGPGGPGFVNRDKVAEFLGVTPAELRTELDADSATLATVAAAHGKSRDELKAFIESQAKTDLAQAVTDGKLTQAQADTRLSELEQELDTIVDRTGRPPFGGQHGGDGSAPMPLGASQTPTANAG
jgi:uncharacterized protein YidB (DUF937 family)